jgi:uncharacterized membrane protein
MAVLLPENDKLRLIKAIQQAEKNTSGEIKVHLEGQCPLGSALDRAREVFASLSLHETRQRNGVLFYVAIEDRRLAIYGDQGINQVVPDNFWKSTTELVVSHLSQGNLVDGLEKGIAEAGLQLARFFPYQKDDENEISDDISLGE